jgi:phenylpropionate dioxygenase-like ring-hydroxylating dioxygenase large terminal subunit
MRGGYGQGYALDPVEFGLAGVPRVAQYEGFTFASLAPDGAPFELPAEMKACIDCIIERAPEKAVEVTGGVHKYQFRGNWKAQIENALDHYHPPFTHESTAAQDGRQFARRVGERAGSPLIERSRDVPGRSGWDDAEAFAFAGGHGYEGPMPGAKSERGGEIFERYKSALLRTNSEEQVEKILKNELFHNAVFYPNMNLQLRALYIRVVRPVAVDFSEVNVYPIRLKGAPDEMFRDQIRFLNLTHSASSLIQTDDVEMFRRVEVGLRNSEPEWILLGRGLDSEAPFGSGLKSDGTAELAMRNQFKAWAAYMSGEL